MQFAECLDPIPSLNTLKKLFQFKRADWKTCRVQVCRRLRKHNDYTGRRQAQANERQRRAFAAARPTQRRRRLTYLQLTPDTPRPSIKNYRETLHHKVKVFTSIIHIAMKKAVPLSRAKYPPHWTPELTRLEKAIQELPPDDHSRQLL